MTLLKLAVAAGVAFSGIAYADTAPAGAKPTVDSTFLPYATPGILAKIPTGETIHIKCMGSGSPTVIMTAGAGDWAGAWRKVQPQIARTTRVCAWDRPGFGFSSGTMQPQTVTNTTADLEAALKVAHIRGPYIAVGHSMGGYESLLFKDRNPRSVAGMVLVDPSIPDQSNRLHRAAPGFSKWLDGVMTSGMAEIGRCLAGVKSGTLKLGAKDPDGCLAYAADYPPQLALALARRDTDPLRFTAALSMEQNFSGDGEIVINPRRNYGDMPLIVLSATKDPKLPPSIAPLPEGQSAAMHKEWTRAHDEIAALSTRGVNRIVADSTHYIQYDQPQAVIDAIDEVIAAVRSKGASGSR